VRPRGAVRRVRYPWAAPAAGHPSRVRTVWQHFPESYGDSIGIRFGVICFCATNSMNFRNGQNRASYVRLTMWCKSSMPRPRRRRSLATHGCGGWSSMRRGRSVRSSGRMGPPHDAAPAQCHHPEIPDRVAARGGDWRAEAANPARGTPQRDRARQQRSLHRATSTHTIADADPAVGGGSEIHCPHDRRRQGCVILLARSGTARSRVSGAARRLPRWKPAAPPASGANLQWPW
jgi:hypothetical protein